MTTAAVEFTLPHMKKTGYPESMDPELLPTRVDYASTGGVGGGQSAARAGGAMSNTDILFLAAGGAAAMSVA